MKVSGMKNCYNYFLTSVLWSWLQNTDLKNLDTTPEVCVLTSHSNRHRQGADRCTAYRRCPSRSHPVSNVFPQTHTALQWHVAVRISERWKKYVFIFKYWWWMREKKSLGSHLWSWSGTPWVQQSHRWSTEETLQLQAPSEYQQSPSSSGLVSLWFLFSTCTLIYTSWGFTTTAWRCGHVAHSVGCGRRQRCHPLGMRVVAVVIFLWRRGQKRRELMSWHCFGTPEITSLCFSGHEPLQW